jgi:hypothetical protein
MFIYSSCFENTKNHFQTISKINLFYVIIFTSSTKYISISYEFSCKKELNTNMRDNV